MPRPADLAGPQIPGDLRTIHLLKDLTDDHLGELLPLLQWQPMPARSTGVLEKDFAQRVGFIWSGRFHISATAPNGAAVTMASLKPGDTFGHTMAVLGYVSGAHVRLDTRAAGLIVHMHDGHFLDLVQRAPKLCAAMMYDFAAQSAINASRVYELAALPVRARLLAELVRHAERASHKDGVWTLTRAPTHASLAAQIGSAREPVTRHMREFVDDGLLRISRGVIVFLNLEKLRAMDIAASGRRQFLRREVIP